MTARLTDLVVRHIEAAIEDLNIPQAVKDQLEYEVVNFLTTSQPGLITGGPPQFTVGWLVGLGLPTKSGDWVMPFLPLEDPHDQHEIGRLVVTLLGIVQSEVAQADLQINSALNGSRITPGGLHIPN